MTTPDPGQIIAVHQAYLSRSEHAVANYVLAHVHTVPSLTTTELAAKTGVSPPTITRFCRKIGYASFEDFRLDLAQVPPGKPGPGTELASGLCEDGCR